MDEEYGVETTAELKQQIADVRGDLAIAVKNLKDKLEEVQDWANRALIDLDDDVPNSSALATFERELAGPVRQVRHFRQMERELLIELGRHVASLGD